MASKWKISLLLVLAGLGNLPAQAAAGPSVISAYGEQPAINQTRFTLLFNAPIENLTKDDFEVTRGCAIGYLEIQDATAQVDLVDCPTGMVTLTLLANSIGSNVLGPNVNQSFQIEIDATRPTARFSQILIEGSGPFNYLTKLEFSEPVTFDSNQLVFTSSKPCSTGEYSIPTGFQLQASCGYAELQWLLKAHSLVDAAGNTGPLRDVVISINNPAPTPTASPTPTPSPVAPSPTPTPSPVAPTVEPAPWFPPVMEPPTPPVVIPEPDVNTSEDFVEPTMSEVPTYPEPMVTPGFAPSELSSLPGTIFSSYLGGNQVAESEPESVSESPSGSSENNLLAQVKYQAKTSSVPVAIRASMSGADQNPGLWLIGAGSLILVTLGLLRRFSGR